MYPRFDHVDELVQKEALLDLEAAANEAIHDDDDDEKSHKTEPKRILAKAKKIKNVESSERPSWSRIQREFSRDPWIPLLNNTT
jgi:hypothetical protein